MTDAVADRIIEQCGTFIANPKENLLIKYFDEKIDSFPELSEEDKKVYKHKTVRVFLIISFLPTRCLLIL